jgi:hypothetical protein
MRDLAKSMMSFSWAMTLFGLEQMKHLVSDDDSGDRSDRIAGDLEAVTDVAKGRLSKRNASMFDSGDALQRDMVDLTFDIFRGEELKPRKMLDRAADIVEESAETLRDFAGDKKKRKTTRSQRKKTRAASATT